MDHSSHDSRQVLDLLKTARGQVDAIVRMVEDDRYCIDVVNQVQAVVAALKKVEGEILKDHIAHCVEHAIRSGDKRAQREKVTELVATLARARGE